jgi:hypothetical protein
MSPRALRAVVLLVFALGIAGMIVGSIRDSNGMAVTFGLVTAVAALVLILLTAVVPASALSAPQRNRSASRSDAGSEAGLPGEGTARGSAPRGRGYDERLAREVEERIRALVATGADEEAVRVLVRAAVDLGRGDSLDAPPSSPG